MPNRWIEIHDSELERVCVSQGIAELYFSSVYVHQTEGKPGIEPGIGWFQKAVLRIFDAVAPSVPLPAPVELGGGQTVLKDVVLENEIPLPLDYRGKIEFRLIPMWNLDTVLLFRGSGAVLTLIGEPGEIENFSSK